MNKRHVAIVFGSLVFFISGTFAFAQVAANTIQDKLWAAYVDQILPTSKSEDYRFTYSDQGEVVFEQKDSVGKVIDTYTFKDLLFDIKSTAYQYRQKKTVEADGSFKIKAQNDGKPYEFTGYYQYLKNTLYFKIKLNPLLKKLLQSVSYDPATLAQLQRWNKMAYTPELLDPNNTSTKKDIATLKKYRMVDVVETMSTDKAHFKVRLDLNRGNIMAYLKEIVGEDSPQMEEIIQTLLNKIQVKTFVVSGSVSPFRIETVEYNSSFLSVIDVLQKIKPILEKEEADAKLRLSSQTNLSNAYTIVYFLEDYKQDNGAYPKALSDLVPKYTKSLPKYDTANAGTCTQTDYTYVQKSGSSFTLAICLGHDLTYYKAGVLTYDSETSSFVSAACGNTSCEDTYSSSYADFDYLGFVKSLNFSATITATRTSYDFGKKKKLTPPPGAVEYKGNSLPFLGDFGPITLKNSPFTTLPNLAGAVAGAQTKK